MAIQVNQFSALTDDIQEVFNEAASTALDSAKGFELFGDKDTMRRTEDYQAIHGLSGLRKVSEGGDLPSIVGEQGDSKTFTQSRYGGIVSVTKDMRMFELYQKIDEIVRSVGEDAIHKVDQSFADLLIHGFATTAYTDVYGESVTPTAANAVALFSASHTNGATANTFRNLIRYNGSNNPVLSREAVVSARTDGMNHLDVNNLNRPVMLNTLLVTPANYDLALRIVGSDKISGSFENDINPLRGSVTVKEWSRLTTAADGTSGAAYWFMYESGKSDRSLKAYFAERPSIDPPEQVYKNKNWDYSVDFYYSYGAAWMAHVWGSQGTA